MARATMASMSPPSRAGSDGGGMLSRAATWCVLAAACETRSGVCSTACSSCAMPGARAAREQVIGQRAERIDVAGDSSRVPGDLLRRGVLDGETATADARRLGRSGFIMIGVIEQPGDAKVEQLGRGRPVSPARSMV